MAISGGLPGGESAAPAVLPPQAADIDLNGHAITNVTDPVADADAANKRYVDENAGGGGVEGITAESDHINITPNGESGYIEFTAPEGVRFGADPSTTTEVKSNATSNQTITFPDASGQLATEDYVDANAGASSFIELSDFDTTGQSDGDIIYYDEMSNSYKVKPESGGGGGASTPRAVLSHDFATVARYELSQNNGAATLTTHGIELTGTTNNYDVMLKGQGSPAPIFDKNPSISWRISVAYMSSYSSQMYLVLGFNNSGSRFFQAGNGKYIGFKIDNSFGTVVVQGITADGSSQNAVTLTPTVGGVNGYSPILTAVMTSGSNVDFYIDGEFLGSSTANLPSGSANNNMWLANFTSTSVPHGALGLQNLTYEFDLG